MVLFKNKSKFRPKVMYSTVVLFHSKNHDITKPCVPSFCYQNPNPTFSIPSQIPTQLQSVAKSQPNNHFLPTHTVPVHTICDRTHPKSPSNARGDQPNRFRLGGIWKCLWLGLERFVSWIKAAWCWSSSSGQWRWWWRHFKISFKWHWTLSTYMERTFNILIFHSS